MTARSAGSTKFVAPAICLLVVHEMYVSMIGSGHSHAISGWKADVYDYARWEYGTEDAARWLLRDARRRRRTRRTVLARILALFRASTRTIRDDAYADNRVRYAHRPP